MQAGDRKPPRECVLLADQHPTMLRGLKNLLEPEFEVIAMADNALSCVDAMRAHQPALVVVEVEMSSPGSVSLARHLAARNPSSRIVVIGPETDSDVIHSLLDDGCAGFVLATRASQDLVTALHSALEGQPFISDLEPED